MGKSAKIPGGYYIKARKQRNSEIAKKPPHFREIWDWLIEQANHKKNGHIPRGSCVRTLRDMQEGLAWWMGYRKQKYTKAQCENAMRFLRARGMITTAKTTRGMVIEVLKYNEYQNPNNYEYNSESNNGDNKGTTVVRHYKQECIKNEKNVKNKKEINLVFAYWQKTFNHSRAKLTRDRRAKIASRLKEGYSLNDLKRTIDGCKNSSYHQGENDQGKIYDSIELLFRNGDKVESFWQYTKNGVGKTTDTELQFSKACAELGRLAGKKRILDWLLVLPEKKHGLLCKFLDRAYRQGHSYSEAKDEWRNRKD